MPGSHPCPDRPVSTSVGAGVANQVLLPSTGVRRLVLGRDPQKLDLVLSFLEKKLDAPSVRVSPDLSATLLFHPSRRLPHDYQPRHPGLWPRGRVGYQTTNSVVSGSTGTAEARPKDSERRRRKTVSGNRVLGTRLHPNPEGPGSSGSSDTLDSAFDETRGLTTVGLTTLVRAMIRLCLSD